MNRIRAMSVRPRALPLLIGALALALATGGRASAQTCLLSSNAWSFTDQGKGMWSIDGAGAVALSNAVANQGPIAAQHPILSGTVQNVDANQVEVSVVLYDSGGSVVGSVTLESLQVDTDSSPSAVEGTTWSAGSTSSFTIDAKTILAQHFPGIDLSKATSAGIALVALGFQETAVFSNLCLTDSPQCLDTTPPILTLNGASTMTVECHTTFTDPGATATDACGASLPATVSFGSVDTKTPGTYKLTYSATDPSGNTGYVNRWVTVADTTPPVVTLNGAAQLTVECHGTFTDPGATANDACAGSLPAKVSFGSVDVNTPGTYKLTYTATDPSGNGGYVNRWVTVADTTPPVVTLNGASTMTVECHGTFTDPGATATDTCAGTMPAKVSFGSVDVNTPGTYKLTYSATDPSGNTGWVNRWVTVADTTPPVVTLNGASTMTVECHGTFTDPGATASDACAGSLPATVSFGNVDTNTPGTYKLTYTATDPSGNSGYVNRWVTVADTTAPVVTPPANITHAADAGQCSAQLTVGTATATDTCAGSLTPTGTRSDGKALTAAYPVGTTTITWGATDPSGNTGTAKQTVTVLDQQPPTISCPANITVAATSASGATVNYPAPTASDNCGSPTVTSVPPSGSTFPLGTTTVTCRAIDAAGNQNACSFTVTVTPDADLSLTMSASPSPVLTGNNLTYTLVVKNNGPQPAQGVVLTDPLPGGVTFASAAGSPATGTLTTPKAGATGTVTWNLGTATLGSGQSATLTVVVKVGAKVGATINNIASVSSSTMDPNPGNNSATVSTAVVAKH